MYISSKFSYDIFQRVNNKGADQTARVRRLVCVCKKILIFRYYRLVHTGKDTFDYMRAMSPQIDPNLLIFAISSCPLIFTNLVNRELTIREKCSFDSIFAGVDAIRPSQHFSAVPRRFLVVLG